MKRVQTSTGSPPPVAFLVGELSSLPSQTPVTSLPVKPMNQASRKSWLVPVLPAAVQPGSSALRAVPEISVSCIIVFIIADRARVDDLAGRLVGAGSTAPCPARS